MARNIICILSMIFVTLSYLISYIIAVVVVANRVSKEEFVYYLSKIATIKNIVRINHNSKIFDHFNSDGELEGITTKYNKLLNLTSKEGCKEGYKKCGVFDTIGNTLCIDNNFGCPINKLTVDLLANKKNQNFKGMKEIYNENLIYNYKFYYSNESLNGNSIVSLLFMEKKPRYITSNNFIVDLAAYKDNYNDDLNNNNNNKNDNGMEFGENLINIIVSDNYLESILKASYTLYNLIINADNDKEKFKDYVEEKLENEENDIDKYYINVGENAYIKNYIGFKSLNDINKFFNFDYNIYKYNYPTKTAYILALIIGIIGSVFLSFFPILFWIFLNTAYKDRKQKMMNNEVKVKENEKDNRNNANDIKNSQLDETVIDIKKGDLNKNSEILPLDNKNNYNTLSDNITAWEKIKRKCKNCRCKKRYIIQYSASVVFLGLNLAFLIYSALVL